MTQYSILTICNSNYFPLLVVMLTSLKANAKHLPEKIFIGDIGLTQNQVKWLSDNHAGIQFIQANDQIINNDGTRKMRTHNPIWCTAVNTKTKILKFILQRFPDDNILLMDNDLVIFDDFIDMIPTDMDISLCERTVPMERLDGIVMDYIGCLCFFKGGGTTIPFIDDWRKAMVHMYETGQPVPYETPSLCNSYKKCADRYKFGFFPEYDLANCDIYHDAVRILHLKNKEMPGPDFVRRRCSQIKNFDPAVALQYLPESAMQHIAN